MLASDGVTDNLYNEDILACFKGQNKKFEMDVQEAASCIGNKAFKKSEDVKYESPFTISAREAGKSHEGGKSDDITVVVGQVKLGRMMMD